jgi:hypothetical protein
MNIDYKAEDPMKKLSETELDLLHRAEHDKENGRVTPFISNRDVLGR